MKYYKRSSKMGVVVLIDVSIAWHAGRCERPRKEQQRAQEASLHHEGDKNAGS